jgi:hypothetical protein
MLSQLTAAFDRISLALTAALPLAAIVFIVPSV